MLPLSLRNSLHSCSYSEHGVTLPRSVAPSDTALQLDAFPLQMQSLNLQILFRKSGLIINKLNRSLLLCFYSFVCFALCFLIAAVVCFRADAVIGR
jgi:hypothetical protein